jgi:hypothetical protein
VPPSGDQQRQHHADGQTDGQTDDRARHRCGSNIDHVTRVDWWLLAHFGHL